MTKPFLFFSMAAMAVSCSNQPENTDTANPVDSTIVQQEKATVDPVADFKFHSMLANLPSPLDMFEIMGNSDAEFEQATLTDMEKSASLNTMDSRAFGYGVYMTDLGYLAFENNKQEALKYLQTCRTLAQGLGAGEVFDRTISGEFEESTASKEKFVAMMETAFEEMDNYMKDNERFVNATQIFIGSWVESQLLATEMLRGKELSEETRPIYQGIYEQKMHASNLMNVLGEIQEQVDPTIYRSIEDLMLYYAGFSGVESIHQEDLVELHDKLQNLRNAVFALQA